jgi:hypothetical protein
MLTRREKREFEEALVDVATSLDADRPVDDAWQAEQVALSALPVLVQPDAPEELVEMFVVAVAERRDATAAAVLKAQERLAHPPLRDRARAAAAELAEAGIVSPFEHEIGSLRVLESAILSVDGDDAAVVSLLQRPSRPDEAQAVIVFLTPDGLEVEAGDPEPLKEARRRFQIKVQGAKRRRATTDEVLERLQRAIAAGGPMLDEMLFDLAILERALTGEDMRLPRPPVFPFEDEEPEAQDGFAGRLVDQMIADGVDPADPAALAAWMDDYNARPYEERRAITGELPGWTPPATASTKKKQQRRRKKDARKRNRRR